MYICIYVYLIYWICHLYQIAEARKYNKSGETEYILLKG